MLLPATSVLSHPITATGAAMVFEPRRPVPAVTVEDRSQPLGTYPAGSRGEKGSDDESRKRRTTIPLANIPTATLMFDTKQEAKFPDPISERDHEVLSYPTVCPAFFICQYWFLTRLCRNSRPVSHALDVPRRRTNL